MHFFEYIVFDPYHLAVILFELSINSVAVMLEANSNYTTLLTLHKNKSVYALDSLSILICNKWGLLLGKEITPQFGSYAMDLVLNQEET